jgi:hypothetical protein
MNDIDTRDERLGQLLDRAVRGIEPRFETDRLADRGRRTRAARLVASVAVVSVFVAALGWAAMHVGDGREAAEPVIVIGSIQENGWTASYPDSWHLTPVSDCGINDHQGGFVVSNVDFTFHDPEGGPPGCDDRLILDGFPDDGVALYLMPTGFRHSLLTSPTTVFPLALGRFDTSGGIRGGLAETYQTIVIDHQLVAVAHAWVGSMSSSEDRAALASTVASVIVRGGLRGSIYRDDADGFSVSVPDGWQVADQPINTWVTDPKEILAVATYRLVPGGEAVADMQVPGNAVDGLGPSDMFIWVSQRAGADASYPPKPIPFSPGAICSGYSSCEQGRALGIEGIRAWWFYFRSEGRGIYVFIGMGEQAFDDPGRAQQAWDVLDSLTFDPTGVQGG